MSGESEPKLGNGILMAKAVGTTVEYMTLREGPASFSNVDIDDYKEGRQGKVREQAMVYNVSHFKPKESSLDQLTSGIRSQVMGQGLTLSDLQVCKVESEELESLRKGDLLLIDPSSTSPVNGQVFVFEYMNNQLIRETQLIPGKGWLLKTNNDKYQDQLLDLSTEDGLKIIGKVVVSANFF
ncbi:S24 family peptidase [Pseudomonas sp. HK3]